MELSPEFDVILKRMLELKPISKEEISARIKADRAAKKAHRENGGNDSAKG